MLTEVEQTNVILPKNPCITVLTPVLLAVFITPQHEKLILLMEHLIYSRTQSILHVFNFHNPECYYIEICVTRMLMVVQCHYPVVQKLKMEFPYK